MKKREYEEEEYEEALKAFVEFLKNCGINTIVFHQFDFLIMYFPVYMLIRDLKKFHLKVKFDDNKDNDFAINLEMARKDFESLDVEKETLNIGLCEPVVFNITIAKTSHNKREATEEQKAAFGEYKLLSELMKEDNGHNKAKDKASESALTEISIKSVCSKAQESYFLHLPFISFPPLYGVSLLNNPVINEIRREKSKEGMNRDGKQILSIVDYWNHFSAKLSLLDKKDFKKLRASSYPKGSTTDWFVRKKIGFPLRMTSWCDKLENEFEDLFNGIVDIAFSVQPWEAVSKSELNKPPLDINIVYKNLCDTEFDCTSLIFKTSHKERLILGDHILNHFKNLLGFKINELYSMHSGVMDVIDESLRQYCNLLSEHKQHKRGKSESDPCNCIVQDCKNMSKGAKEPIRLEDGCLFENKMALRLTNDSQIYKELKHIEDMEPAKVAANYIYEKFRESPDKLFDLF